MSAQSLSLNDDLGVVPEMNTTPLIDVMLVLLIMFIITIPIQTHAVRIDMPIDGGDFVVDPVKNKIVVDARGVVFWNGEPVGLPALSATLERTRELPRTPELHVEPDARAPYGRVDEVLAVTKRVGVEKMGFVGNERYEAF